MKIKIADVLPGSISDELEISVGDHLIAVNGVTPLDMIEYGFLTAEEYLDLEVEKKDGERLFFDIEKDPDEDLGLVFGEDTFDSEKRCKNKCIFCFVDQMPENLRDTLYVKDDDYRLSFLYGNFITMTNLTEKDLERIKKLRISPLYISVHTTNPSLRRKILGNPKAGDICRIIGELAESGIEMHTQVVLCPGINDGRELDTTIETLSKYWPAVNSVAVVPVGLTRFQKNPSLRVYRPDEAAAIVEAISQKQIDYLDKIESRFVFLADEFYLTAGKAIPDYDHYEGFPQIENGVGLVRLLWQDFQDKEGEIPSGLASPRQVTLVTGESAKIVLQPLADRFNRVSNLDVELQTVTNRFFGSTVTVAGLLTGSDLISGLAAWRHHHIEERPLVLIPSVMLKFAEDVFLDGLTVSEVADKLSIRLVAVAPTAEDLINQVVGNETKGA